MRKVTMQLLGVLVAGLAFAGVARADDTTTKTAPAPRPITVEVVIKGRVPRPQAAVDILKIAPSQPLAELKQPLVDRIEKVVDKAPF